MLKHSCYRERLERLCYTAGLSAEQRQAWLARYVDGVEVQVTIAGVTHYPLAEMLGCHHNTARNRLNAAEDRIDAHTLPGAPHRYEPGCGCYACDRRLARMMLDCLRNTGMSAKRPERAPCGEPGPDGRAWPLRGPLVTVDDVVEFKAAVLARLRE